MKVNTTMIAKESSCELASRLSFLESNNFSYNTLDDETRFLVGQRTSEIKNLIHRSAQDIFDIGQKLIEVKEKLGHGRFGLWLNAEFNWSQSAARKFMRVARQFKMVNFADLNMAASALYLLASNSTSFAARQEAVERAKQGEIVNHSNAKSIIFQHKSKTDKHNLPKQITIDVSAETVDQDINSDEIQQIEQLPWFPDKLSKQSSRRCFDSIPVEANKIYKKLIYAIEDTNPQLLELVNDEELKLLIAKSQVLTQTAKKLLTKRWNSENKDSYLFE